MAFSLRQLRDQILTSIHGRQLGLDANNYLVGPKDLRFEVEDINVANIGSSILPYGMTRITSSANGGTTVAGCAFTLQAPVPGLTKQIFMYGASTSAHVFGLSGGAVVVGGSLTSAGSTMISLFRQNAMVELKAISTGTWLVMHSKSSANASSDMWGISYTATVSS